jgi:hypothetical protein
MDAKASASARAFERVLPTALAFARVLRQGPVRTDQPHMALHGLAAKSQVHDALGALLDQGVVGHGRMDGGEVEAEFFGWVPVGWEGHAQKPQTKAPLPIRVCFVVQDHKVVLQGQGEGLGIGPDRGHTVRLQGLVQALEHPWIGLAHHRLGQAWAPVLGVHRSQGIGSEAAGSGLGRRPPGQPRTHAKRTLYRPRHGIGCGPMVYQYIVHWRDLNTKTREIAGKSG